jgi:thymidylate synthase
MNYLKNFKIKQRNNKMARIYENCNEAINEIERDIMEMGIRVHPHSMQNKDVKDNEDFSTMEVQNYTFTILDSDDYGEMVANYRWLMAEFAERMTKHINPGEAYKLREDIWSEFLVDSKFDYTYSERLNQYDQVHRVIEELEKNPDSRQAIVHVHEPEDVKYMGGTRRIPCSMYYQLMIRRDKVDIIYNMRSSDFDTHFRNDIALAIMLRNFIADALKREVGLFHMNVGSLHRYKNYTTKHVF